MSVHTGTRSLSCVAFTDTWRHCPEKVSHKSTSGPDQSPTSLDWILTGLDTLLRLGLSGVIAH